nr:hypothetical protein [Tanacetum cinerariifolium]
SQQTATRNKGKVIIDSPQPIYDQEPSMVAEDDKTSKDKEIDKLMVLISLSFKKIYKPTNNLQTSSNTNQEASGSLEDLEIIQEEDTHPYIDTSLHHEEDDQEIDEPQSDINPIRRFARTRHPTDRLCLYVNAKEPKLGDLGELANYKASLLDPKSDKWLNAMNVEMQSMRDNKVQETIPMQKKLKLSKSQGASTPAEIQRMQNIRYASAVGSIMYAVRCTRPDFVFAQNMTSRFQHNPGDTRWELRVSCYTDVGYLTDADDLKSQTGYVFVLNGGVVDWKRTKQSVFVTSYTYAEYIAAFDASKEVVWIQNFIYGLGVVPTIEEPINMYCDHTRAIAIVKNHGVTKGARYFYAKVHYLRETIEMGDVMIEKVDTYDNLANHFTKALAFLKHSELTKKIRMIPSSSLM